MTELSVAYVALGVLFVAVSVGGGAALALIARRLNPALPFRRLWVFYSLLLAAAVAGYTLIALL